MTNHKLIKKIFNLVSYDFHSNFTNWFSITGIQAVVGLVIFCGLFWLTAGSSLTSWAWAPHMIIDCTNALSFLFILPVSVWIQVPVILIFLAMLYWVFLVTMQNSLDLAFDSLMSGLSIHQSFIFSWNALPTLSMFLIQLTLCVAGVYLVSLPIGYIVMIPLLCLLAYVLQLNCIITMHGIEYKKEITQSYKDVRAMICEKSRLLWATLALQSFCMIITLLLIYVCLGTVIDLIMPMIFWFFTTLHIMIAPIFIAMLYNFFYLWVYLLLYAWMTLVTAHLYRQLVCPPVDNPACASCTSCEK